ncbi:unnamed protein product [Urochloa decumbens]|uniref:Protein kinase domain-containing protein n=1 Tax=Urochloa decumbens TaxID=240449 RepID=A0ABC9AZ49_9POAL
MADPLGSLEKIVKLALTIKEAVDTVRQNKEECQQIRTRAVRVSSLLSRLPDTGMTADPAMCGALQDLEDSLQRAHTLVAACQDSTTVCLYCTAGKQARRLRRVQDDISQKVMLVVFATNIQTTIILTNIRIGDAPRAAEQAVGETIAVGGLGVPVPMVAPCDLPLRSHALPIQDLSLHPSSQGGTGLPEAPSLTLPSIIRGELARAGIRLAGKAVEHSLFTPDSCSIPVPAPSAVQHPPGHLLHPHLRAPSTQGLSLPVPLPPQGGLRKFSLSELEAATHRFSIENVIGSGASVTVYKGVLHDGLVVAIKKFRNPYSRSEEHIDQLHLVSKLKHKNIVKLIGYGSEVLGRAKQFEDTKVGAKEDKEIFYFFVEEYMPNGSLNKIISGLQLDWSSRFLLIQGIAQGLCYLHKENVVHLDIKPSNVLLDSDMNPKITDFGIARVLNHKGVDICADIGTIAGTLGYMPPEYITDGTLSKKQDVYGFGVTLLEIISGMSRFKSASGQASIQWAWKARQAGGTMELLDPSLFDMPQLKEIERCVAVGLLCTQFDPTDRPGMVDALEMLCGEKALRTPVRPGYTKESTSWFGGWHCLR